jgi:hypothetical protein
MTAPSPRAEAVATAGRSVPLIHIRITRRDAHPISGEDFHIALDVGKDIPDEFVQHIVRESVLQIRRGMEHRPNDPVTVNAHALYDALDRIAMHAEGIEPIRSIARAALARAGAP